jgi:fructokinase
MRIGIDLGGTKIEGLVIDEAGGERLRRRVPTPTSGYEAVVAAIVDLVTGLEADIGARASVGIGIPGTLSPATGLVKNANSTRLIGHPLDRDLEARLGRPVRVANDANCFALSEATDGAAAPEAQADAGADGRPRVVFGVILGTGVGGGVAIDGRVLVGPNGIAGEWGHNPLPWPADDERPGPACYCGKHGCVETWLSGPGLARDHERHTGERVDAATLAARAEAGDPAADATFTRYEDRLARGLATVMNVLDPDVIVLGGGVSNARRLYENVPRLWGRYVFSDTVRARLVPNRHGDSSGVRGAAWLWPTARRPEAR